MTSDQQTAEQGQPKLRIREARDIFEALVSNDFGMRLSVARAIAANPEKASSYGTYNGMELVDYLFQLIGRSTDSSYRTVLLSALAAFRDPRIPDLFMSEMAGAEAPETVMAAAARLAGERGDKVRRFMSRMLRRNAGTTQARMAANIMAGYDDLQPEERVRIAALADVPFPAPPFDDATEQAWLRELSGESAERTRALLEDFGASAFLRLRGKWRSLDENSQAWLLRWGARDHQLHAIESLTDAINHGSPALVLEALRAIKNMGPTGTLFHPALARFVDHEDMDVRIAAIGAGAPLTGIRDRIKAAEDADLRLVLIPRLVGEEGALQALLDLLADDRWEIRAAATQALITMGEPAVHAAEALLSHGSDKVRASAAQIVAASESARLHTPEEDRENDRR